MGGLFTHLRRLYSADSLDTRFTIPASVPLKNSGNGADNGSVVGGIGAATSAGLAKRAVTEPSKWNTLEFYVYYVIFVVTVPYMFKVAYDVSKRTCTPLPLLFVAIPSSPSRLDAVL
jgi:hypothetical protein